MHFDEDHEDMFYVDPPKGKRFAGTETHSLGYQFRNVVRQSWKSQAYDEALRHLADGLKRTVENMEWVYWYGTILDAEGEPISQINDKPVRGRIPISVNLRKILQ